MTVQFKLSGSVGKMGANKPADVKIIQACLSGIKVKMKPLYRGKADGKAGKDLIDAICAFQGAEKIKPSGKIMPGDSTTSKLKMRTPSAVSGQLQAAMIGTVQSGPSMGTQAKVASATASTATAIKSKSPIPKQQAEALAKIISNLGKKGVPLTQGKTDITDDGRFGVDLSINTSALPTAARTDEAMKRMQEVFRDELRTTSVWRQPVPGKLRVVTGQSFEFLKGLSEPSAEFIARHKINKSSFDPAGLKLLAATERLESREVGDE